MHAQKNLKYHLKYGCHAANLKLQEIFNQIVTGDRDYVKHNIVI